LRVEPRVETCSIFGKKTHTALERIINRMIGRQFGRWKKKVGRFVDKTKNRAMFEKWGKKTKARRYGNEEVKGT